MRIVPLAAALAALTGGLAASVARAAFPGRNGPLTVARREANDGLRGTRFIRSVGPLRCEWEELSANSGCGVVNYANPAVSPDGRSIVFDDGEEVSVVNADGSGYRRLGPFSEPIAHPSFAPDGRRLVAIAGTGRFPELLPDPVVSVVSVGGGAVHRLVAGDWPRWSTTGWIAFIGEDGQLYRIRPEGRRLRRLTGRGCDAASWSPDGRRIACLRGLGIVTLTADGRDVRRIVRFRDSLARVAPTQIAWAPNGRAIAAGSNEGELFTFDLRGRIVGPNLDIGQLCGAEYCWWRQGFDWGPAPG